MTPRRLWYRTLAGTALIHESREGAYDEVALDELATIADAKLRVDFDTLLTRLRALNTARLSLSYAPPDRRILRQLRLTAVIGGLDPYEVDRTCLSCTGWEVSMRRIALVIVGMLAGCTASPPSTTTQGSPIIAGQTVGPSFTVVFTVPDHQAALSDLLSGSAPTGYRWVRLKVDGPNVAKLATSAGLTADWSDPAAGISFAQSYVEDCNPIKDDYSRCWYTESYSAGQDGLTGQVALRTDATTAYTNIDITWEGTTDRYGNGSAYWYRHGTETGFAAPLVQTVATP